MTGHGAESGLLPRPSMSDAATHTPLQAIEVPGSFQLDQRQRTDSAIEEDESSQD